MTWKFDGYSKSDIVLSPNNRLDHKSPIYFFMDRFEYFFFFDLEIWWGFQIRYCTLPQIPQWTTKVLFLVYGPIWIFFFSLIWKVDGDSKSDIEVYLKWLSKPQEFVIMIRCKINFDIFDTLWYLQLFYTCQYSSHHLISWTSFLWMLSFLFYIIE